jgi:hypothetical protein
MKIAGIDVHKKVLMVVVVEASAPEERPTQRRFATMPSELHRRLMWLQQQGVEEAVMESSAQYWRSVWLRIWRSMTRMKLQLTRDRVRLQNQMECLLEENKKGSYFQAGKQSRGAIAFIVGGHDRC